MKGERTLKQYRAEVERAVREGSIPSFARTVEETEILRKHFPWMVKPGPNVNVRSASEQLAKALVEPSPPNGDYFSEGL